MRFLKKVRNLLRNKSQKTSTLLDSLIDNISDIVAVVDSSGRIIRRSQSLEVAVKKSGRTSMPIDFADILEERNRFDYEKLVEYVKRENKPVTDFRLKTALVSGKAESLLSIIPVGPNDEPTQLLLHILRPAEDSETAEPDYGRLEKLTNIGQIAAGMAHELNTPLGAIILSAEHVMEAVEDQDIVQEASRIRSRAEHCSKVVRELLGYVRPDDQGRKSYGLLKIVEKVTDLISWDARRKNIELTVLKEDGDAIVECNENQIEQLMFNLVANASHAIGTNGKIEISFRRDQLLNRVYIVTTDSGSGITPENITKIFDPFFTTKPGAQGTGLGLALCKKIVLEHGGDISVKSKVGVGTTFEVWMPVENE